MKFSLALAAVFLPIFVNAQNINVCRAFVIPSIFVDVPQVVVSPGDALTYNPSNFTASNGTSVTFVFTYDFPSVVYLQ
jgi:plastocyanin